MRFTGGRERSEFRVRDSASKFRRKEQVERQHGGSPSRTIDQPKKRPYVATHARGDVSLLGRRRSHIFVFFQRRRLPVIVVQDEDACTSSVFKNTVFFRKPLVALVSDDAYASSLQQSQLHDPLQKTVFSCLDLRAGSSAICRAASCEPARPIATDSAPHLRTSEARSPSSGAR